MKRARIFAARCVRGRRVLCSFAIFTLLVGCGTVGPPVAPLDIGVGAKLSREKSERERQETEASQQARSPVQAEPGTRIDDPSHTSGDTEQLPGFFERPVQPNARPSSDVLVRPR